MMGSNRRGFTLVELMVALSVLLIVGVNIYQLRTENLLHTQDNQRRQQAVWLLAGQADHINSLPYSRLSNGRLLPFSPTTAPPADLPDGRCWMDVEEVKPGLKRIILTVAWRKARGPDADLKLTLYRSSP